MRAALAKYTLYVSPKEVSHECLPHYLSLANGYNENPFVDER